MIGEMAVEIEVLPRMGSRVDVLARVKGPGETDYTFPLSITSTIQAIWGIADDQLVEALRSLVKDMFSEIVGTASPPPKEGYWFDSYNSAANIKETLDRMRNLGQTSFLRNPASKDQISKIFGGGILETLERLDEHFFEKFGMRFINPLDYSFERTQAEQDLGGPPSDNPSFLYRICILSVLIDGFQVRTSTEKLNTPSLKALTNWLSEQLTSEEARKITEPFARVKDLRKQYPIHEHFVADSAGQKVVREEVQAANTFFDFKEHDDFAAKWKKVTDSFKATLAKLEKLTKPKELKD